jgi:RNA-directed DNA polymerase
MDPLRRRARLIASCIVDTEWTTSALAARLATVMDGGPPEPRRLAARLVFHSDPGRSPDFDWIVAQLESDPDFADSLAKPCRIQPGASRMRRPPDNLVTLPLPRLTTLRELACWLGLSDEELDWFTGARRRYVAHPDPARHHYRYRWRPRRNAAPRLIEEPKARLKSLQRDILHGILDRIPPHDAAHGFRRHRSCRSAALPHVGSRLLLRMDLEDFFLSINRGRVAGIFRLIGYPETVAVALSGLCTHRSAAGLGDAESALSWQTRARLASWHLPQGAPTSPALANLCAWRLDARLSGLAASLGLAYTRYADDIALSGTSCPVGRRIDLEARVGAIALEEGFRVQHRKTHWAPASQCQRFCGIVVNRRLNSPRCDYDRLKATLHNCARLGPGSQNLAGHPDFRRHLQGRIAHLRQLNAARGAKLAALFDRIRWPD